jgi:hypothetical protein
MSKTLRFSALVVFPAVLLVLFGARWFRRDARGAAAQYLPVVVPSPFDQWHGVSNGSGRPRDGHVKRWWVIGWDGASWDLMLPLLEQGRLPNLKRLMDGGSSATLYTIKPTFSPVVWTTIATGMPPSRHGIFDFVRRPEGFTKALKRLSDEERQNLKFYSNADRRVHAIWNLVSDRNQPVLIVGYHNTYPAERVNGVMVSNYLIRQHSLEAFGRDVESLGALASPAALVRPLSRFHRTPQDLKYDEMSRFADVTRDEFEELRARVGHDHKPSTERWMYLSKAFLHDQFHAETALELLPRVHPDLMMLHFQIIDWTCHEFLQFHGTRKHPGAESNPPAWRRYDRTVTAAYEYADEWLGKLLAQRDEETGIVVISDHGFEHTLDDEGRGQHNESPPGILVLEGPGIRRGGRIADASVYDILPTLAVTYGISLSQELKGRVLKEAFSPGALGAAPSLVASYETKERFVPDVAMPDALESELASELKALGYVN